MSGLHPAPKPKAKSRYKKEREEFARKYHSEERVEFVKSLPCAACGVVGYSENAHVLGNDGMSRKGEYTTIAPLCHTRPMRNMPFPLWLGCHPFFDSHRGKFDRAFPDFDPVKAAADTYAAWAAVGGEE